MCSTIGPGASPLGSPGASAAHTGTTTTSSSSQASGRMDSPRLPSVPEPLSAQNLQQQQRGVSQQLLQQQDQQQQQGTSQQLLQQQDHHHQQQQHVEVSTESSTQQQQQQQLAHEHREPLLLQASLENQGLQTTTPHQLGTATGALVQGRSWYFVTRNRVPVRTL